MKSYHGDDFVSNDDKAVKIFPFQQSNMAFIFGLLFITAHSWVLS